MRSGPPRCRGPGWLTTGGVLGCAVAVRAVVPAADAADPGLRQIPLFYGLSQATRASSPLRRVRTGSPSLQGLSCSGDRVRPPNLAKDQITAQNGRVRDAVRSPRLTDLEGRGGGDPWPSIRLAPQPLVLPGSRGLARCAGGAPALEQPRADLLAIGELNINPLQPGVIADSSPFPLPEWVLVKRDELPDHHGEFAG